MSNDWQVSSSCESGACVGVAEFKTSSTCESAACVGVAYKTSTSCDSSACVAVGYRTACDSGACVGLAECQCGDEILIANTTTTDKPPIRVTRAMFGDLLAGIKAGEFDEFAED